MPGGNSRGDRTATGRVSPEPTGRISCPVTVEAGSRILQGETLHFTPAKGRHMDVEAIVWRSDDDGPAFFFTKATPADPQPSQ